MAKLTLSTITSGYASVDTLNANFDAIETALENTLSRDGTAPNYMSANLDMNSNRILNLPEPSNNNEPARLADVQAAVAGGSAAVITFSPTGNIAATNVQAAIAELDSEKAADADVVHDTGDETIAGVKTFSDDPVITGGSVFRKNLIIGGNFTTNPWQRGGTFTSIANGAYCADRWVFGNTSAAVLDALGTADSPTAAEAGVYSTTCLELDVTTADATLAAGDLCFIGQVVEGVNIAHMGFGQSGTRYLTLSFWHKHTKTGTHCVALRNSAVNRSYVAEYTQDVSNTWEKATITFAVDTSGTWLYDTGVGLRLTFALAAGTTYQTTANAWTAGNYLCTANQVNNLDSTSNDFKIALIQLEAGTVATEFENLDVADVEQLCERYCYIFKGYAAASHVLGINHAIGASTSVGYVKFPTTMRGAPTLTVSDPSHFETLRASGSAADACTGIIINGSSTPFGAGLLVESANLVAGDASRFSAISASSKLTFSAEL